MNCKRKSREFTLLGRFLAKSTEQIDASRVCWRQEYIKNPKSRNHRWGVTALVCQQTRGPSIRSVISVTNRPTSSRKPLTSSMMLSKKFRLWTKKSRKKKWQRQKGTYLCGYSSSMRNNMEYGIPLYIFRKQHRTLQSPLVEYQLSTNLKTN